MTYLGPNASSVVVDVRRTPWLDRFFSVVHGQSPEELLRAAAALDVEPHGTSLTNDLPRNLSGATYWVLYIKGYLEYCLDGGVVSDNTYLEYLTTDFVAGGFDRGLDRVLADKGRAARRVTLRYRDADKFRHSAAGGSAELGSVRPPLLRVCEHTTPAAKLLYSAESQVVFPPVLVDGYHRFFLARLFGMHALQCQLLR